MTTRSPVREGAESTNTDVECLPPAPFAAPVGPVFDDVTDAHVIRGELVGGRYALEHLIAQSEFGQVFAATQVAVRRRVAIKTLRAKWSTDTSLLTQFEHRAHSLASIDHGNVVRVIDLLVGNSIWLVMQFVEGPSLEQLLRAAGSLEPARALGIASRLCWAVDAVHAAGLVHRDIRSAHIILTPEPATYEQPKLVGFALATITNRAAASDSKQALAVDTDLEYEETTERDCDARSDVYALGRVLFEMISGRAPRRRDSDIELLYKALCRRRDRAVAAGICAVLERALAISPTERFKSAREMAQALQKVRSRASTMLSRRAARRRRLVVRLFAIASILAILSAGLIAFWYGRQRTTASTRRSSAPVAHAP
jgi:serine/threonine protein kinase